MARLSSHDVGLLSEEFLDLGRHVLRELVYVDRVLPESLLLLLDLLALHLLLFVDVLDIIDRLVAECV